MSIYAQAAADFLEAVAMRDVAADIAEMSVQDFIAPWRGASFRRGIQHVAADPVGSAGAAAAIVGSIGLPAAIKLLDKHKKNGTRTGRKRNHRYVFIFVLCHQCIDLFLYIATKKLCLELYANEELPNVIRHTLRKLEFKDL